MKRAAPSIARSLCTSTPSMSISQAVISRLMAQKSGARRPRGDPRLAPPAERPLDGVDDARRLDVREQDLLVVREGRARELRVPGLVVAREEEGLAAIGR